MWRNGSRSTVGGDVNWCRNLNFFRKLKIELRYDPAVPLLGIYPEKTIIQKDTFIPMFTAALLTTARTRKQPKSPLMEEWIKKMWDTHTKKVEYYSAIKKEQDIAICSNVDEPRLLLSEVSQTKTNII